MKITSQNRSVSVNKFASAFLFAGLFACVCLKVSAQDTTRIGATWQVEKYDLSIQLPTAEADRNVSGKAKLDLRNVSSGPASSLTLRISSNATISSGLINGNAVEFSKATENLGAGTLQRISARIPAVAPGAAVAVVIDYKLSIKDNSGLAAVAPSGSHFLPLSFWYPTPNSWYFARGADYAPTRIQVSGTVGTVASGSEVSGVFEQKLFVQPFFVSVNWEKVSANGVDVFAPKEPDSEAKLRTSELAALAADAKAFFSSMLGPAPDVPLRIVSVRRGGGFASGGTVLVDEAVFRRPKIDSLTAMNVAEAVARLWVADPQRMSGDGSGVIREGLPRYFATQFIESKFGKGAADVERLRQRVAYSLVSQRDSPLIQASPLDDYYYSAVANKGAMIWRLLSRKVGAGEFNKRIRTEFQDNSVSLAEMRSAFADQKDFLDAMFDKTTDTNLLVGLPQPGTGETKAALRNTGATDVTVNVTATLANGEKMIAPTTIRATSFGEVSFKTPQKVTRLEVDSEKLYPQTDYSDDVAPRETTEGDLQLTVKRAFDKQDFAGAENAAKVVLREFPSYDDVRILYARSLLGLNRNAEAEREFKAALDEKLPTSRTMAWGNLGLAESALRAGQNEPALKFAEAAIRADAEYGAGLAARNLRNKISATTDVPDDVKAYFANFDRVAVANRKTDLEALVVPGESTRFVGGISGQTTEWKTTPTHVDRLDPNTTVVETQMSVRLLNRENETGMAVYRLVRSGGSWKLYSVDIFEVR
jgi:tetratricopeptide (TPR) repeat protein